MSRKTIQKVPMSSFSNKQASKHGWFLAPIIHIHICFLSTQGQGCLPAINRFCSYWAKSPTPLLQQDIYGLVCACTPLVPSRIRPFIESEKKSGGWVSPASASFSSCCCLFVARVRSPFAFSRSSLAQSTQSSDLRIKVLAHIIDCIRLSLESLVSLVFGSTLLPKLA